MLSIGRWARWVAPTSLIFPREPDMFIYFSEVLKYNLKISRCILHANVLLLLMAMAVSCVNNHCSKREITNRCIKHTLLELSKHGHNLPLEHINKYDASGNKHGIWIDENESFIYMTSYKNGQKDGIETIYYKLGKRTVLCYIIYYTDGFSKHIITYSENGNVSYTIENFELNDIYPEFKESFPYIGYTKNYYPSVNYMTKIEKYRT